MHGQALRWGELTHHMSWLGNMLCPHYRVIVLISQGKVVWCELITLNTRETIFKPNINTSILFSIFACKKWSEAKVYRERKNSSSFKRASSSWLCPCWSVWIPCEVVTLLWNLQWFFFKNFVFSDGLLLQGFGFILPRWTFSWGFLHLCCYI